ncbi:uncharacterized protein LOC109722022 isoform X2 [Ananas comosus]|uniref:Uncharacterized protein LOC109722022 isoform X2 n=1 Tax=Ananas comosus TaxID=4615 RepID=A0A6P5GCA5_ANACO|nr:uncharacterized protein LOC109722022 isoform X2 [Ananas comosus]
MEEAPASASASASASSSASAAAAAAAAAYSNLFYMNSSGMDVSYRPLPSLYLAFLAIWAVSGFSWTFNTWRSRHFQANNLQWILSVVPLIKALQLALSFSFWYSCINLQLCSLWMSFGVYITGILFQTACFVSFMLISHGYCIMCERLSIRERRTTATLGCFLYLSLIGYKAAVPYFTVFLLLNYSVSFYVIFRRISHNLLVLREQLNFIEDEEMHTMHHALNTKYTMFKRFQGTMQIVAIADILVYMNVDETPDNYWFRLLVREWVQFCIFLYIGWTFRTQEATPHFSVMPALRSSWDMTVPPIYSVEMDASNLNDLVSQEWHVAVPTSFPSSCRGKSMEQLLVVVQNPRSTKRPREEALVSRKTASAAAAAVAAATITVKYQHAENQV